jgi:hypothetical protein
MSRVPTSFKGIQFAPAVQAALRNVPVKPPLPHFSSSTWYNASTEPFSYSKPHITQSDQFNRPINRDYFKSGFVINLKRRPDRLSAFRERFPQDWDFLEPAVFYGIDGEKIGADSRYCHGAFGCMMSHLAVIEKVISEDLLPCIVFEDDFDFYGGFTERMHLYLEHLPSDYRLAYFGGQHLHLEYERPVNLNEYVAKPFDVNRFHGYIINNSEGLAEIYHRLRVHKDFDSKNGHIDHNLGRWMEAHRPWGIYCPANEKWFGGQVAGYSDISLRTKNALVYGK